MSDPTTPRPDIGIVGLPDVAAALRSAGLVVVGGGAFGDVAKTIRQHLDDGAFPILSTAVAAPGLRTWLSNQAGKSITVGVVAVDGAELAVPGAEVLGLPCALDDLVCGVGLDPIGGQLGAAEVHLDGSVSGVDEPSPGAEDRPGVVESDPWSAADPVAEPVAAPAAEPTVAPPAPPATPEAAPPGPAAEDPDVVTSAAEVAEVDGPDEFADPLPVDAGPTTPAGVPSADPWSTPAPVAVDEEPEAPSHGAPPAPVEDVSVSPWDDAPPPPSPTPPVPAADPTPAPVPAPAPTSPPPAVTATPAPAPPPPPAPPETTSPPVQAAPAARPVEPTAAPPDTPPAGQLDIDDVFDVPSSAPTSIAQRQAQPSSLAPVVFVIAAKGGVGKTTMTTHLGQRAGEKGLRPVVVDANRGQADITTYLRLGRAGLPTVAEAASAGRFEQAILGPDRLNGARHARLEHVTFSAILGPPPAKSDPRLVTADVYRQAIELARRSSDIVIVDTQITEATDTSGLIDGLVVPMIAEGAWALAVTDLSSASVRNLHGILDRWRGRGVPRDRVLLTVNRADPKTTVDPDGLAGAFANVADMVGLVHADPAMIETLNRGAVRSDGPELLRVLDTVLHRVTGFDEFDPAHLDEAPTSLFDRFRRRRGS